MKPLIRLITVIFCLALGLPPVVKAQNAATWYFAWDNTTQVVSAYTYAGGNAPLLTIDPDLQPLGWRLDNERALAVLGVDGQVGLYILTPTTAQPITPLNGADLLLPSVNALGAQSPNHVVLLANQGAFTAGLLVDLAAQTIEPLTGETFTPIPNWRFSTDGTTLYYLSRLSRDTEDWNIWARTLSTGDEFSLHDFSTPFPVMQVAADGSQWLYTTLQESPRQLVHNRVNADATESILSTDDLPDANTPYKNYIFMGQNVLSYTAPCQADCVIDLLDPTFGSLGGVYNLPRISSPQVTALAAVDDSFQRVLALIESEFWLLISNEQAVNLGVYNANLLTPPPAELVSPDGQWAVVSDGGTGFKIWNLAEGVSVLEGSLTKALTVRYSAGGVILYEEGASQSTLFQFADRRSVTLPHLQNDRYLELLDDGTVVYVQAIEAGGRPAGIYRYNPADGAYILILQNASLLLNE